MAAFHYNAINPKGEKRKGIIEAESEKHARQLLRDKNLITLNIHSAQKKNHPHLVKRFKLFQKETISNKELTLITRQLATLLSAGLPVEEVLNTVAEQSEKSKTKGLMLSIRSKVKEGYSLASALQDFPAAFSALYCATISAGEKSGHLDKILQRLADYTEQQFNLRQKIQNALIYPSIMILVSIGIVGFLLEYVVPRMISVYSNIGQTLPTMTQILISLSNGIGNTGIYFIIALTIAIFSFRHYLKNNLFFKEKVHKKLLLIPIIGNSIKIINTARFSRTFAILSTAGVPILEAMSIASKLITNIPIRKAIEEAAKHVREGSTINLSLKQTRYFPPMSLHLIASGEASGQLENMLERAANNQDNEITNLIETTLTLFEPLLILIMGATVLFIVLAVLLPIFQLDQLIA